MSAAENLASWREAKDAVVAGVSYRTVDAYEVTKAEGFPALLAFAEAVVELHKPLNDLGSPPCKTCISDVDGEAGMVPWPCPTYRLAEQHLGGAS